MAVLQALKAPNVRYTILNTVQSVSLKLTLAVSLKDAHHINGRPAVHVYRYLPYFLYNTIF